MENHVFSHVWLVLEISGFWQLEIAREPLATMLGKEEILLQL